MHKNTFNFRIYVPFIFVVLGVFVIAAIYNASRQGSLDNRSRASDFRQKKSVFADVTQTSRVFSAIERLYTLGITKGCATNPLRYCPDRAATRAEAAVLILRAKNGATYAPPAPTGIFADVPVTNPMAGFIEQMYQQKITSGCGVNPLRYCPDGQLTREAVAAFIIRAKHGQGFSRPTILGYFDDVTASNPFAGFIEQLLDDGVTSGCSKSPARYCPKSIVTRGDLALFIYRTFAFANAFSDVPKTYWAAPEIERIYQSGITSGCSQNPLQYCPDRAATRGEVVTLILRGRYGKDYIPPTPTGIFEDVPTTAPFAAYIEKAYADGLTSGCGVNPLRFCPNTEASRGQVATMFMRQFHGRDFAGAAYEGTFSDVPASHPFAAMIEQFQTDAITIGCSVNPARYCPDRGVTRAEMAVFLTRMYDIP
jgi:hypothetical protein